jgi:tRNA A-37 threonylcarbamoyl transferase component Bud32
MAKSRPSDERLASFCWQHDTPSVERMLRLVESTIEELDCGTNCQPFDRSDAPLGSFAEAGWRDWIESIQPHDDDDKEALKRLYVTSRIRLGFGVPAAPSTKPAPSSDIKMIRRHNDGLYGIVWEGRQESLARKVAVKIIQPTFAHVTTALDHARALARTQHPNVVTVYQVANVIDPETNALVDGIVMEWLEGDTLGQKFGQAYFSAGEAHAICSAIISGLSHIHAQRLTHNDFHAGNVIVTPTMIKIIDIHYTQAGSFAALSSQSRETRIQNDIDYLLTLIRQTIHHSHIDTRLVGEFDSRLRGVMPLDSVHVIVEELFTRIENPSRPEQHESQAAANLSPLEQLCATGLEHADAMVLKEAGDKLVASRHNRDVLSAPAILESLTAQGLAYRDITEAIEALDQGGFIDASAGGNSRFFQLSFTGLDTYLRCCYDKYEKAYSRICFAIVNDDVGNDVELSQHLEIPRPVVLHVLDVLEAQNLCNVSRTNMGTRVIGVSVDLRRKCRKR